MGDVLQFQSDSKHVIRPGKGEGVIQLFERDSVDWRLKGYFSAVTLAFQYAHDYKDDLIDQQLHEARARLPLGIQIDYRRQLENIERICYQRAAERWKNKAGHHLTRNELDKAQHAYERLHLCGKRLNDKRLDETIMNLGYELKMRRYHK